MKIRPPADSPRLSLPRSHRFYVFLLSLALCVGGAISTAPHGVAVAQGGLTATQLATIERVRALTTPQGQIKIQRTPEGSFFVDLQGRHQMVLLTRTDARGRVVIRCVDSVESATAFLSDGAPLAADALSPEEAALQRVAVDSAQRRAALAASTTTITINPIAGFSDPTPAAPVGGNKGTTVGAQRLEVFTYVAGIWASYLQSTVPITIDASFSSLHDCTILGSAAPQAVFSFTPANNPGNAQSSTWYVKALANKLAGHDLGPGTSDISATFNSDLGASCSGGAWYYGLDGQVPVGSYDLVTTILHEFGHGLGFISLVGASLGTYGMNYPYDPNPLNQASNLDDIWNSFLYDDMIGKHFKDMSVAERARAITDTNALVWDGPAVTAAARAYLASTVITVTTPPAISGKYEASAAPFGKPVASTLTTGYLVDASDACSPLTNAAGVAGKIALIARGACNFTVKVKNAQDAGAIGAIIVNNVAGGPPTIGGNDPSIAIVAVGAADVDGATMRAALRSGPVKLMIGRDPTRLSGVDGAGRVRMFAPNPIQGGSSILHFDTSAYPNLLMEPFSNPDLGQSVDLTDDLLRDIGWYPDINYNHIPDTDEVELGITQTATPLTALHLGSAVTITLTITSSGRLNASAAHIVDAFPAQLGAISWAASYSGGASGPASGIGNIDRTLAMPSGSAVIYTISSTVVGAQLMIRNTASVASSGIEIDGIATNNQAAVRLAWDAKIVVLPLVVR